MAVVASFGPTACEAGAICDSAELRDALANATTGDGVRVGSCRLSGRFVVPAGVALRGDGVGRSVLTTSADATDEALAELVLDVTPGRAETVISDLTIEATLARSGLVTRGAGDARIERVHVRAGAMVGIGAEDVTSLGIADTTIDGDRGTLEIDGEEGASAPRDPARAGLAAVRCGSFDLANVTVSHALSGALLVRSTTRWVGGGAPQNAGSGVLVDGGDATLDGLDLSDTAGRDGIAAGVLFRGGATGSTLGVEIVGSAGLGIVQDDSGTVSHVRPEIRGTRLPGIWAQRSALDVSGDAAQRALVEGASFAGIVALQPSSVRLVHVAVRGVGLASFPVIGAPVAGDALQLVLGTERPRVTFDDVVLAGGDRAALVLDVEGVPPALPIEGVTIECTALGRSAVRQGSDGVVEWPGGAPDGGALCESSLPTMRLEVASLIEEADLPSAGALAAMGLAGIEDDGGGS